MITGVSENMGTEFFSYLRLFETVIIKESLLTDCQQNKEYKKEIIWTGISVDIWPWRSWIKDNWALLTSAATLCNNAFEN